MQSPLSTPASARVKTTLVKRITTYLTMVSLLWIVQATAASVSADAGSERLATTRINGVTEQTRYPALQTMPVSGAEEVVSSAKTVRRQAASLAFSSPANTGTWIYTADIQLITDYDHDGHYSGFSVSLDVDSLFAAVPIYAVLYLSYEGGPWNEYAVTGDFLVTGSVSSDSILIETELEEGYPSGSYDHYIEIYDANAHQLLGSYGPQQSSFHYGLTFEGSFHEGFSVGSSVSLSFSGTGSMAPALPIMGTLLMAFRRRQRVAIKHGGQ